MSDSVEISVTKYDHLKECERKLKEVNKGNLDVLKIVPIMKTIIGYRGNTEFILDEDNKGIAVTNNTISLLTRDLKHEITNKDYYMGKCKELRKELKELKEYQGRLSMKMYFTYLAVGIVSSFCLGYLI